jgi:hypothetical protein
MKHFAFVVNMDFPGLSGFYLTCKGVVQISSGGQDLRNIPCKISSQFKTSQRAGRGCKVNHLMSDSTWGRPSLPSNSYKIYWWALGLMLIALLERSLWPQSHPFDLMAPLWKNLNLKIKRFVKSEGRTPPTKLPLSDVNLKNLGL